jgi:hypothetical protein
MHPETMYELVKLRHAEDLAQAERERLVRRAAVGSGATRSEPIRFRARVARLLGSGWAPSSPESTHPAGA